MLEDPSLAFVVVVVVVSHLINISFEQSLARGYVERLRTKVNEKG